MTNLPTLAEAYQLGLDRTKSRDAMKNWEHWVRFFMGWIDSKPEVMSGKWKMAHMMLSRLGVEHDNCSYCNTAGEQ